MQSTEKYEEVWGKLEEEFKKVAEEFRKVEEESGKRGIQGVARDPIKELKPLSDIRTYGLNLIVLGVGLWKAKRTITEIYSECWYI